MRQLKFSITANASGAGSVTHTVSGAVMNVYAVPGSGFPSTGDFTVVAPPEPGVAPRTLLSASNIGTSPVDYPLQVNAKDASGAAISGTYEKPTVCGDLTITVAGGGNGGVITFYVIVLDSDAQDGRR